MRQRRQEGCDRVVVVDALRVQRRKVRDQLRVVRLRENIGTWCQPVEYVSSICRTDVTSRRLDNGLEAGSLEI